MTQTALKVLQILFSINAGELHQPQVSAGKALVW